MQSSWTVIDDVFTPLCPYFLHPVFPIPAQRAHGVQVPQIPLRAQHHLRSPAGSRVRSQSCVRTAHWSHRGDSPKVRASSILMHVSVNISVFIPQIHCPLFLQDESKPPYSYAQLIVQAISSATGQTANTKWHLRSHHQALSLLQDGRQRLAGQFIC